jgi:hypothetical protein
MAGLTLRGCVRHDGGQATGVVDAVLDVSCGVLRSVRIAGLSGISVGRWCVGAAVAGRQPVMTDESTISAMRPLRAGQPW